MLQEFITSALIIDDKKDEINGLEDFLDSVGIWAKHYTPENLNERISPFNNRKLIFLDLYIDETDSTIEGNISRIRKHFEKVIGVNFGSYGIALWTKDPEKVQIFSNKIFNTGDKYTRPLFVVALDKTKYLRSNDFSNLLADLESELSKDVSASFFVEWNKAVKKGSDETISTLYNLFDTNEKKKNYLEAVLFKLACNLTGIPLGNIEGYDLQKDLVKSLMDTLQFEISNNYENVENLFSKQESLVYNVDPKEKETVFSKLNSMLLLDFHNTSDNLVIPGNIYEVIRDNDSIYFNNFFNSKGVEIKIDEHDDFKTIDPQGNTASIVNKRIVIEITPPCDFAGRKKQAQSRVVGGIMLDFDEKLKDKYFKGDAFYSFLYPINIVGIGKPQMIIFDFYRFQTMKEDDLKDVTNYKVIMKAKDKLFADVLQKLSAHTARLGIAILNPKY